MSLKQFVKGSYLMQEQGIRRVGTNADYVAGGNFNIFNIANGPIKITSLIGICTVTDTGNLLVPLIVFTPAGGGAASNMCVVKVAGAMPIDTILSWDGGLQAVVGVLAPAGALGHSYGDVAAGDCWDGGYILCAPGIISITNAILDASAAVDWAMTFIPLGTDVEVTAV